MRKLLIILALNLAAIDCNSAEPNELEPIVITVTRISEDVAQVPASVTVIGGDELRDRGATDLRGALSLVAGVDLAPGSDAGPAASVPEFWGLKEADAFLLVVDGVPWGGVFNPSLSSLDLRNVDRIEVMRGAAPVMYGATSFVGVIHVIHKAPSKMQRSLRAFTGSWGSRGGGASIPLAIFGKLQSAISVDTDREGFRDPRTRFMKDHAHWRGELNTSWGTVKFNTDADLLRTNPASPHLREGTVLSSRVPLDSNQNLRDAYLDEDRYTASVGLDHPWSQGTWSFLLSYSHLSQRILRGFLADINANPDAHGFRESIDTTDLYLDSHVQWNPTEGWKVVGGLDHLHGRGFGHGGDFDYFVAPNGSAAPTGDMQPSQADIRITDQRDFSGLYGFAEWEPHPRWILEAGARLNHTQEVRRTSNLDLTAGTLVTGAGERHDWRAGATVGVTWKAWSKDRDLVNLFVAYRNTFKPAATDFGLDTNAPILAPETAQSYETGVKSRSFDDHLDANLSLFLMDFRNQVINTTVGGRPAITNAGATRFKGMEIEAAWHPLQGLTWQGAYSLHDARFRDSVQLFGGVPSQLAGNRLETSARNMFATGLTYAPKQGFTAGTQVNYVGSRFLDKRNRALTKDYMTWSAGAGYRQGGWELRLDAHNINDQRPPVSESELGDAQYYLLPARTLQLTTSWSF